MCIHPPSDIQCVYTHGCTVWCVYIHVHGNTDAVQTRSYNVYSYQLLKNSEHTGQLHVYVGTLQMVFLANQDHILDLRVPPLCLKRTESGKEVSHAHYHIGLLTWCFECSTSIYANCHFSCCGTEPVGITFWPPCCM